MMYRELNMFVEGLIHNIPLLIIQDSGICTIPTETTSPIHFGYSLYQHELGNQITDTHNTVHTTRALSSLRVFNVDDIQDTNRW